MTAFPDLSSRDSQIASRFYEALNHRDFDTCLSVIDPSVEWLILPFGNIYQGLQEFRIFLSSCMDAFDNARVEIKNSVTTEDWVAVEYIGRGRHTGSFMSPTGLISPTGKEIELQFCDLFQVRNGRIVLGRTYFDSATLFRQLGMISNTDAA